MGSSKAPEPAAPPKIPEYKPPKVHIPAPPPLPEPLPPIPAAATAKAIEVQGAQSQVARDAQSRDGLSQSVLAGETAPLLAGSDPTKKKKSVLG